MNTSDYIDQTLKGLVLRPDMYARTLSGLEGQVTVLLNVQALLIGRALEHPRRVRDKFIRDNYPDCGSGVLCEHLDHLTLAEYAVVLSQWINICRNDQT